MTVGVSGPWTPFATLSASMARTRRQNCQISPHAREDSPTQKADISELEKTGHFCFALTLPPSIGSYVSNTQMCPLQDLVIRSVPNCATFIVPTLPSKLR